MRSQFFNPGLGGVVEGLGRPNGIAVQLASDRCALRGDKGQAMKGRGANINGSIEPDKIMSELYTRPAGG